MAKQARAAHFDHRSEAERARASHFDHPSGPTRPDVCKVCFLYDTDSRYRALYDGNVGEKPPRKTYPPMEIATAKRQDLRMCVHIGDPTGDVREIKEGKG